MTGIRLNGVHHISCITGDAPGNVEFYAGVLGMRLVKKTVNQDDPNVYHLFYGDEDGSPGFDITFFEYPGARQGRAGRGMIHRILWRVGTVESLDYWAERLGDAGVATVRSGDGFVDAHGIGSTGAGHTLMFDDPEGLAHELLVYEGPDEPLVAAHREIPAAHAIQGFQGARAFSADPERTEKVLADVLGFESEGGDMWRLTGTGGDDHSVRNGYYNLDPAPDDRPLQGAGTVHHIAWSSPCDQHSDWRERVAGTGLYTTPVIDRFYFKAVYFREPGGVLFELATIGPGFTADEPAESLGERLSLPPDFEDQRATVEPHLRPLPDIRQWRPDRG